MDNFFPLELNCILETKIYMTQKKIETENPSINNTNAAKKKYASNKEDQEVIMETETIFRKKKGEALRGSDYQRTIQ